MAYNKLSFINKLVFSVWCLLLVFGAQAQQFADKDFYLIDSLVLDDLSESDRAELDSILPLYHAAKSDTVKLNLLEGLVEMKWVDSFWYDYHDYFIEQVEIKLGSNSDELLKAKKSHYKGAYHYNIAFIHENQGNLDKALFHYHIALDKFTAINDLYMMGDVANMIGLSHYRSGDLDKAMEYYKLSIKHWTAVDEYDGLSVSNIGIASIMQNNGFMDKAKSYYKIAYDFAKKTNESYDRMANIKVNLSKIAESEGDFDLAIALNDSALILFEKINYPLGIAHVNFTIGHIYDNMGEPEKALHYCEVAYAVGKEANNNSLMLAIINELGHLELEKGNFSKSERYAEEAMDYAQKSYNIRFIRTTYELLQDIYTEKQDYKKALEVNVLYNQFKDSIYNDEVRTKALETSVEFEYEKQKEIDDLENQQKLELAEQEKKRTRLGLIFAAILAGLVSLVSVYIFKQKKELDNAYEQLEESKKNELAVSNLKALQSQMNPHFIFNALNSVQDLVLLQDIRNSNKYLGKFSDLIRKILLSSKEQFISLSEEVEILRLYLDLEKLRFGKDFEIDFKCHVDEDKQDDIVLPAMFIQPYIENAIKHGLFHKEGIKKLKVHFTLLNDNALECIVEDNGIGQEQAAIFKEKRLHLHIGFSTEAINERIKLLNETLDKKIELEMEDLFVEGHPAGTKIRLIFPI